MLLIVVFLVKIQLFGRKGRFFRKLYLDSKRGYIYDRNFRILAVDLKVKRDRVKVGEDIYEIKWRRGYPYSEVFAPLVGFIGKDEKGLEGLEYFYDSYLSGTKGCRYIYLSAIGDTFEFPKEKPKPPLEGKSLVLTVDADIQEICYYEAKKAYYEFSAKDVRVIVLNPKNGEILAMVNYPSFDPHNFVKYNVKFFSNRCISALYEPGSIFKIVVMTSVLESKRYSLFTKFYLNRKGFVLGNHIIRDVEPRRVVDLIEGFAYSSNQLMAKFGLEIGPKKLYEVALRYGFGTPTYIDLVGESFKVINYWKNWGKYKSAYFSIGYGVMVNLLQLCMAYASIANGGYLLRPRIIKGYLYNGRYVPLDTQKIVIRKVANDWVISKLKIMLEAVVKFGTGVRANFSKYVKVAGKTGTAQKVVNGKYSNTHICTFVGYFPAENPEYLIGVVIDGVRGYASETAAVLFSRIARKIWKIENAKKIQEIH